MEYWGEEICVALLYLGIAVGREVGCMQRTNTGEILYNRNCILFGLYCLETVYDAHCIPQFIFFLSYSIFWVLLLLILEFLHWKVSIIICPLQSAEQYQPQVSIALSRGSPALILFTRCTRLHFFPPACVVNVLKDMVRKHLRQVKYLLKLTQNALLFACGKCKKKNNPALFQLERSLEVKWVLRGLPLAMEPFRSDAFPTHTLLDSHTNSSDRLLSD